MNSYLHAIVRSTNNQITRYFIGNFPKKTQLTVYIQMLQLWSQSYFIHCRDGNSYRVDPENIYLFGLAKTSTYMDNLGLYALYFGCSPRQIPKAFKWFCITLYDMYYRNVIGCMGLMIEVHNVLYYTLNPFHLMGTCF